MERNPSFDGLRSGLMLRAYTRCGLKGLRTQGSLNLAVFDAVAKVNHETDRQPDQQTQPVFLPKTQDHRTADQHGENRD